jgi:DNA-binding SARP family transcriptional activator
VRFLDVPSALRWLRQRSTSARAELDQRGLPSTFAGRSMGQGSDGFEPVMMVYPDDQVDPLVLEEIRALAAPGSGAAVIVVNPPTPVGEWALRIDGDRAVLEPLGVVVDIDPVSVHSASQLAVLLDVDPTGPVAGLDVDVDLTEADPGDARLTDVTVGLLDPDVAAVPAVTPCDEAQDPAPYADPDHDIEVRILGDVEVHGTAAELKPLAVELLTFLAVHRRGESSDMIRTQVWPEGKSQKTFDNNVSNLRVALGAGADGELLVPYVKQQRYRVSDRVLTDWDRFLGRMRHAETVPSGEAVEVLSEALELVHGRPFRSVAGYDWAITEGLVAEITETVKMGARRLAELYLEQADPLGAVWAVKRGQMVVDTAADSQHLSRLAMEAHAQMGDVVAAVGVYKQLLAALEEMDCDPIPEVVAAYRMISRGARAS